jgi:hypothetical protein
MPTAGPLRHATVLTADSAALRRAYVALGLVVTAQGRVDANTAAAWGQAQLGGCACIELGRPGATLLRIIEVPHASAHATARATRYSHGWLALEVLVRDVDALAAPAAAAGFEIVGAPADLALSPNIRAMQLVGPAGEMLYLTQVKAPVPPFELPLSDSIEASQNIGPLFIAVMSTPSRAAAMQACAPLMPRATLCFDTKVTVLNRALGRDVNTAWPLATVQLAGQCLFEVDEVVDAQVHTPQPGVLPAGLAWVSVQGGGAGPLRELSPGAWLETTV